jgi:GTP pyrophosphokinase
VDREFRKFGLNLNKAIKQGDLKKPAEELGYRVEDDLLAAVGYGKIAAQQLVQKLVPAEKLAEEPKPAAEGNGTVSRIADFAKKLVNRPSKSGVSIGGVDDVLVRFGRCCNPVPGDPIAGFITRGRGVTVHTVTCEKALATDPERRVEVSWDVRGDFKRPVTIRVLTADRPGLLADISNTFSKKGVNISQANCRSTGDDRAVNTFEVVIKDLKQLTDLMRTIEQLSGVFSVERI